MPFLWLLGVLAYPGGVCGLEDPDPCFGELLMDDMR